MKALKLLPAVFVMLAAMPAGAQSAGGSAPSYFVGGDGNWFDPQNWSTGRVPDASTDVVIGGGAQVVIDPANGSASVAVRDLAVVDGASLTTLPGTIMEARSEYVANGGQVIRRGSGSEGGRMIVDTLGGLVMNPSTQSKRELMLKSGLSGGFGGTTPASIEHTSTGTVLHAGPGHYSTLSADTVVLGGQLALTLYYGFQPKAGDQFQLITANRLVGQFEGLPEGALVGCTEQNVGFYITYQGGDGNDVVLTAEDTPASTCAAKFDHILIRNGGGRI